MDVEIIVDRLIRYAEHLYYQGWQSWEFLALGFVVLLIVILAIKSHRKAKDIEKHLCQRMPDERLQDIRDE